MMVWNRNLLFQGSIFRFHVSFRGCRRDSLVLWKTQPFFWVDFEKEHMTGLVTNSFLLKFNFPQRITCFFLESISVSPKLPSWFNKKTSPTRDSDSDSSKKVIPEAIPWMVFWWLPTAENAQLGPKKGVEGGQNVVFWTKARQIDPVELNTSIETNYAAEKVASKTSKLWTSKYSPFEQFRGDISPWASYGCQEMVLISSSTNMPEKWWKSCCLSLDPE